MKDSTSVSAASTNSIQFLSLPAICLFAALSQPVFAQDSGDHQYSSAAIDNGSRVYVLQCALCHGPQGEMVDGINLRRGQFRTAQSDADLRQVITEGAAEGRMPAFALLADEMEGVIAYIRAGFNPDGVAVKIGDPQRGQQLFEGVGACRDCHRVNGVGPRTAPDLSDIGVLRNSFVLQSYLLDPAASLMPINRPVRIVTRQEETITGRRLNEDTYTVQLIDSQERLRSLLKSDLVRYEISETPTHQPSTFSSEQIADLLGYLLTLRGLP